MASHVTKITLTANEFLADRAIRHQLFLTRLQTHEANQLVTLLEEATPDMAGRLERRLEQIRMRGFNLGPATTKRLRGLLAGMNSMLDELYARARTEFEARLVEIAAQEAEFQSGLIHQSSPVRIDMTQPSLPMLRAVVASRPFEGRFLKEWFDQLAEAQKTGMERAIRLGVAEGETIPQIVQRIRGTRAMGFRDGVLPFGRGSQGSRQAAAVARTAVNHVATHAKETLYEGNGSIVKSVRIVATLDGRTTHICQRRDGQVFPVGKGPRPPFHVGCRTTTTPILKSWREMGINLKEAPEGTRASMNGQVPAKLTYGTWLKNQGAEIQDEALGKTRGRAFRSGKIDIESFTDRRGRAFTLKELRRREPDSFATAP